MIKISKYAQLGLTLFVWIAFCQALDEESVKERRCFEVNTAQDLDWKWLRSISKWYIIIWHKLELYRTASDITGDPISSISSESMDTACVLTVSKPQLFLMDGFNRTEVKYEKNYNADQSMQFLSTGSIHAKRGTSYMTMTNNADFVVGVTCWEDNEMSYSVWSSRSSISPENQQVILDYLEKLGFEKKFMVETPFNNCKESERVNTNRQEL